MVIRTIPCDDEVRGLTAFRGKLHVLRDASNNQVDIYKMNAEDNNRIYCRHLTVTDGNFWDITCSTRDRCMFVSDHVQRLVCNVTIANNVMTTTFCQEPRGLSMMDNSNLLVTCRSPSTLVMLDRDGFPLDTGSSFCLDGTIQQPWHAVQLSTGNFAVCHGGGPNKLHRVCIVDGSGRILISFGTRCGSDRLQLNVPCHLAVDENDFIFVADCLNERVTLLTPTLNFVHHVIDRMDSRPQRLYLDRGRKHLYVGQRNGDVLVLEL